MEKIWSFLMHLGTNMWNEEDNTNGRTVESGMVASGTLRFDRKMFREAAIRGKEKGMNTIILDLGEGLFYETHPELAVEGSLTRAEMETELAFLHSLGYEVVPKLNFSASHDVWMGEYERMLSTKTYYRVCADLIGEVCDIFKPKYFHLGMDEETGHNQIYNYYCVVRQYDLWWHDFLHLVDCVEKGNARPWIWSDYLWHHTDEFLAKCPKSVIQSNWYYWIDWEGTTPRGKEILHNFELLDKHGFDQVPTGANCYHEPNMLGLVQYTADRISNEHLLGYMNTSWRMTYECLDNREKILGSIDGLSEAKKWFEAR